ELDACGIGFVADARGRASRDIVAAALTGLACVKHRGALAADARSSDGSGLLVPIPPAIFGRAGDETTHGVAMLMVRGDDPRAALEEAAAAEGISVVDWRTPPTDDGVLGELALATRPTFLQAVLAPPPDVGESAAERAAFRLRRRLRGFDGTYLASCSFRTVLYKGLVVADALADFFLDLADERFAAPFAIFHQRFSTNTLPTWERAQPFRMLCHNGEINALAGNINRMRARAVLGTEAVGLGPEELFHPVVDPSDSDSGQLDSVVELLTRAGRDVRHAVAMTVPEAWEGERDLDPAVRGFYRYHASLMEPWDGPAGMIFTDGLGVGAALDRNGLRPIRYAICDDGLVVCCSEAGAVDVSGRGLVRRGRLGPGQMLFVDPGRGVLDDAACKERLAAAAPWARWAADGLRELGQGRPIVQTPEPEVLERRQAMFGYTREELTMVVRRMASDAKEPTYSMGDDSPLPHLAGRPRPVHHYLKQRFAQVTNPPIDHLRERLVMSLRTTLGPRRPILVDDDPRAAELLVLKSFFVYPSLVVDLLTGDAQDVFGAAHLDASFLASEGPAGLRAAVDRLCDQAQRLAAEGTGILVIDDGNISDERVPVPALIATGAVHHRLVACGLRPHTSLVVSADDARDVHYIACLLGYGADAICPGLALETVAHEADRNEDSELSGPEAQNHLQSAMEDGVLKVMSKMGISTVDSYRGAQIFEILGLGPEVVDVCFTGTPSVVGGIGWEELGRDALERHANSRLGEGGYYRALKRAGAEYHTHNDDVTKALNEMKAAHLLQAAVRGNSDETYERFATLVNGRPATELHDLLELVPAGPPVPLEEVEPARAITRRFSTGAMSHGALSREAHETLAEAMNLIGGASNCGEGGEGRERFRTRGRPTGDKNSRIKQIASGRFGVTPEYCAFADELNIKIAQGSKPGEGGQIPGAKVSEEIATLRHTQPGIGLISPPPHHDIYSIEDLAQLIYDLKQVNRLAEVSVKLVAEDGVGTIAAGVAKALAEVVHISGSNGGTGASPLMSIKHAGLPWELGLADTQAALIANGLRDRIRVRIDGGLLTGRDILMGALLGADEYSFGTAAMIAEGCIMARACHKDTCPTGIATQRPHLRAKFAGTAEGVAAYMLFIAEEVRRGLAALGLRTLDEAIGRVECLRQKRTGDRRADTMDLSPLITPPQDPSTPRRFVRPVEIQRARSSLGDRLVEDAFLGVFEGDDVELRYRIANADRTVGAALGGAIALEWGEAPPMGTAVVRFDGSAGQSFGAFLTHGIEFELVGEANDYVGKGMGGGRIVIRPHPNTYVPLPAEDGPPAIPGVPVVPSSNGAGTASRRASGGGEPVLAGNTCLYGATGGQLFCAGAVGERFAVRNSGATAVVEGVGDHACEYMTGGTVVVLGPVGYNIGAGMTGGQAFVWDPDATLTTRLNTALVEAARPDADLLEELRWLIERHHELTNSPRAAELLADWPATVAHTWLVAPVDEVRRMEAQRASRVTASA
ncbi:MAG TPA: glutamate synthase large subunit, partial [Acidimicrobiales bacterium]|nr:glutamate synthase large subunit [Acidimicrobiales bacterium]